VRTTKGLWAAALVVASALNGPTNVSAQSGPDAALRGVVFDSTEMRPLARARVAVIGTSSMAETGADGTFVIPGVPAGSHWVSFYHERLQQLGVSPPSRQIDFGAGETVDVSLSVPSATTLLAGWCMAEQPGAGFAAIAGVVSDSLTGVPLPRAIVRAETISRTGAVQPVEVRTDDTGYFRICNARANADIRLQAHFGQNSGRSVEMLLPPGAAAIQDLVMFMTAEGTLTGFVRDYATGEPLPGAVVSIVGTRAATLSDGSGRFVLADLPPGRHLVNTGHIGFEERTDSVTIFSEETVDIEVRMATEALEVEGLVVTARTRFGRTSLAGDAKRADFISREEIDLLLPRVTATSDLLRNMNVPGMRVREVFQQDMVTGVVVPSVCVEVSRRGGGDGCVPAAVALNGIIVPFPDQVLQDLDPTIIDRIEILSPVDAQFQFGSIAGNGAVSIYTR
jgi:hypothetical protein